MRECAVLVIGLGHAGCEAALAAARMGCRTVGLTLSTEAIAQLPCNPSLGGPAKGHLVREIDALGGEMGLAADAAAVQVRTLNTGKGHAVRALRAQLDRRGYRAHMLRALAAEPLLEVLETEVTGLRLTGGRVTGVRTTTGGVRARAVVLATGTYLHASLVRGGERWAGGPQGQRAACDLSEALRAAGLTLGRFKTGTPPRLAGELDYSRMRRQDGDDPPGTFSFLNDRGPDVQQPCWLTHTTEESLRLVRENLHRSPLYSGMIKSVGPRYCPSFEDKVVHYPDRLRHPIFVEPDGEVFYVQGLSTSLPAAVQEAVVRTIPGLERAELVAPGYAIEYDYSDPTQLWPWLEAKALPGLWAAGQVNGSSGYEEAAGQGLLAGINAALSIRGDAPLVLGRDEGYLGVMVDDLVTRGVHEPYRLLTSRAEYRLAFRHGNADQRLTPHAVRLGLARADRVRRWEARRACLEEALATLERTVPAGVDPDAAGTPLRVYLRRPEVTYQSLAAAGLVPPLGPAEAAEVELAAKYAGYLSRQQAQADRQRRLEHLPVPVELDYGAVRGLSNEARVNLRRVRPVTVGQAGRVAGVTPADVAGLMVHLEARRRQGVQAER